MEEKELYSLQKQFNFNIDNIKILNIPFSNPNEWDIKPAFNGFYTQEFYYYVKDENKIDNKNYIYITFYKYSPKTFNVINKSNKELLVICGNSKYYINTSKELYIKY